MTLKFEVEELRKRPNSCSMFLVVLSMEAKSAFVFGVRAKKRIPNMFLKSCILIFFVCFFFGTS